MRSVLSNDVCLPEWCLPTCMISSYLYDVCYCKMHAYLYISYLYGVCLPYGICSTNLFLLNCMMSADLHDVCCIAWFLHTCMLSFSLYDVYCTVWFSLPVWCLLNCKVWCCMSLWCFPTYMISAYTCMMSATLNEVWSTVWFLPTCSMSAQLSAYFYDVLLFSYLYYVCSTTWCLSTCVMSACIMSSALCTVRCLPAVWCLPTCMMFAQLRRTNFSYFS